MLFAPTNAPTAPEIDQAKSWLDKIAAFNDYLNGAPLGVLLFGFAVGIGLLLRVWHQFPNRHIPAILISFTILFFCLGAPRGELVLRIWIIRNILIGAIIGIAAFFAHKFIIKKFPSLADSNGDTTFTPKPPG